MSLDMLIKEEYVSWKPGILGLGKSRILVPKGYEQKNNIGRNIGYTLGSLAAVVALTACPVNGGNGKPPVCDTNPAVELAEEYALPQSIVDAVAPLGLDCVVDSNERNLITNLLPGILERSNEQIALSYPERFVGDDGKFDEAENIVMSRFLTGRYDREGLLVHPGYFELVDKGHVQIPSAYFMPIFEMPFRFDPFPPAYNGGKALPIVEDKPYMDGILNFDRSLVGDSISWFQLSKEFITPEVVGCSTDRNFVSMQLIFNNLNYSFSIDKLEVVNPLPVPVRISEIGFLYSNPPNGLRNARIIVEPVSWPSSLGHSGMQVSISHLDDADIESNGLAVDDIIPVEGRVGRADPEFERWRIILSYNSNEGFYREGDEDKDSRFKVIDVFDPQPYNPKGRGLIWPVYYESIRSNGVPAVMNLGVHTGGCAVLIGGEVYGGSDSIVPPMKYTFPADTISR